MKRTSVGMMLVAAGVNGIKVSSDTSTPAAVKVIQMLKKLQKEMKEEGETENKQFEEYARFCRRGTDEKEVQIKKSSTSIERLTANTDALATEIKELETKVQETEDTIKASEEELAKAKEDRATGLSEYQANSKEMDSAITALNDAITTMKSSKGKVVAMPQLASKLLDTFGKLKLIQISSSHLDLLTSVAAAPGQPATYEHKSGDVIAMLGNLITTFKANKHALDMAEMEASGSFQKKELNLNNQIKMTKTVLGEQKLTKAEKGSRNGEQTTELTRTKQVKASDEENLKTLTDECAEKAEVGAQRKKSRDEEQVAIETALEALKEQGIGGSSFVQLDSSSQHHAPVVRRTSIIAAEEPFTAFLQLDKKVVDPKIKSKTEELFKKIEASSGNPAVSLAIQEAKKSGSYGSDGMEQVKKIIRELITNMEKAGENDSSQRDFCLEAVGKQTANRDNYNIELEKLTSQIAAGEAKKKQDTRLAAEMTKEIASAKQELDAATSLRAEEKASNDASLKEATEGKTAVDFAVTTLKNYYEKSFIQVRTSIHAGQPNVPTTEYSGSTKGKGGVLSMLKVVAEDFQRDMDRIPKEEEEAQKRFDGYKTATETDTKNKDELITSTKAAVTELESKLMELESSKQTASSSLDLTMAELDKLKGMCGSDSEKNFKDKKASRAKEIEKLEETIKVIQSMEKQMEALGQ
eukprot:TRINITY_DN1640_c0_g3_i1.p1 TRINITY_DN1640_c0_g3~~TRINITY_DN1640_c0_g3_i1.p1  ORF type:complete len:696 (-),score=232.70 TRINITY_DN1640_c0_g3_i1:141-2228(-)